MARSALLQMDLNEALNPYVGQLTNKLLASVSGRNGRVHEDDWAVINEVLNFAAVAEQRLISQRRRINHLEALSMTDDLTGLANRRALEDYMKRALSAAQRYRENGVIVYIDLDHFKKINDTHGHEAGDTVLREVARKLAKNTRESDLVVRLGGDEFVVVLVRCKPALGKIRALRIEEMLKNIVVHYEGIVIPVVASTGAEPFGPRSRFADVLRRADQNMLDAKRSRSLNGNGASA